MSLKDKLIYYRLIDRHHQLSHGSACDMQVGQKILHFLNHGEIRLGLDDLSWAVEQELDNAGVHVRYSRNGYTAYARIRRPEKE